MNTLRRSSPVSFALFIMFPPVIFINTYFLRSDIAVLPLSNDRIASQWQQPCYQATMLMLLIGIAVATDWHSRSGLLIIHPRISGNDASDSIKAVSPKKIHFFFMCYSFGTFKIIFYFCSENQSIN